MHVRVAVLARDETSNGRLGPLQSFGPLVLSQWTPQTLWAATVWRRTAGAASTGVEGVRACLAKRACTRRACSLFRSVLPASFVSRGVRGCVVCGTRQSGVQGPIGCPLSWCASTLAVGPQVSTRWRSRIHRQL
eukprot:4480382-Prymnesium_polylepis.1